MIVVVIAKKLPNGVKEFTLDLPVGAEIHSVVSTIDYLGATMIIKYDENNEGNTKVRKFVKVDECEKMPKNYHIINTVYIYPERHVTVCEVLE